MKNREKRVKLFSVLSYIGVVFLFAAVLTAAFSEAYKGAVITASVVVAAGVVLLLRDVFTYFSRKVRSVEQLVAGVQGYAEIKYDKKNDEAYISKNFTAVTGIDSPGNIIDGTDYKKLVCELISYPSDAGADIYMAPKPETWFKVDTVDTDDCEFTMISDVSDYVSCKNIIKSLKYYDSETGLLCRDAFMSKVRSVSSADSGTIGLVTILVSGIDKVISFNGTAGRYISYPYGGKACDSFDKQCKYQKRRVNK